MRLLLVGNYQPDRQNSMLRYQSLLQRELSARGYRVGVVAPQAVFGGKERQGALGKWLGYVDKYLLFPLQLRRQARGWDWVHVCDHSNSVYLPYLPKDRCSITCHDLLAIEAADGMHTGDVRRRISWTGRLQQRWIRRHLLRARRVVCVSNATATSLNRMGAAGELVVIHNPLSRTFAPVPQPEMERCLQKAGLASQERYLLHVGGNLWYKNRPGVLRIFGALRGLPGFGDLRLVLAGHPWTDDMRAAAHETGLNDDRAVGPVLTWVDPDDRAVEALYTGAALFLFPSLQEGFGWPVLEAQCCGTAVATSDRDPMREIAGGAAILFNPAEPASAAAAIAASWGHLSELRRRGAENAARYSAAHILPLYDTFFQAALAAAHSQGSSPSHVA